METREDLAKYFYKQGYKIGAEVGVATGVFSKCLLEANPDLKLYCIDAWKVHDGYRDYKNQATLDKFYEDAVEMLKPYNAEIIKGWSMDVVKEFEDNSLDFVYIDANHDFKNVADDIAEWSKKVRKGGVVSGHDYVRYRSSIDCQVKDVVDAWVHAFGYTLFTDNEEFTSWGYIK